MSHWSNDKSWADRFLPEIKRVVRLMSHKIVRVDIAAIADDERRATDYVVIVEAGNIACRVRKPGVWAKYQELTLRSSRPSGAKTEVAKILEGHGDWYLYGWADSVNTFGAWIFVDLDRLRATELMENRKEMANWDGSSGFIGIPVGELWLGGCLVGYGGLADELIPI